MKDNTLPVDSPGGQVPLLQLTATGNGLIAPAVTAGSGCTGGGIEDGSDAMPCCIPGMFCC